MRKKYLSALLFGALLFASAGTFTSCKDYDDDINNLQSQIDKLATKEDMEAKLSQMETAINDAKATAEEALKAAQEAGSADEIAKLEARIKALEDAALDVDALKKEIADSVEEQMADFREEMEELLKKVEELTGYSLEMVTSIDLQSNEKAGFDTELDLNYSRIAKITFQNAWGDKIADDVTSYEFGEGLTGAFTIKKGDVYTVKDHILASVAPVNATVDANMVSLINSKAASLNDYVTYTASDYTGLLTQETRSTANGLREIGVQLKSDVDFEAFHKLVSTASENNVEGDGYVNYALAVTDAEKERTVTSTYDLTIKVATEKSAKGINDASKIGSNASVNEASISDYCWSNELPNFDKWDEHCYPAKLGEEFYIKVASYQNEYSGRVMASYVVVDYDNELLSNTDVAAIKGLSFSGVNQVSKDNDFTITISGKHSGIVVPLKVVSIDYRGKIEENVVWVKAGKEVVGLTAEYTATPAEYVADAKNYQINTLDAFTVPEKAYYYTMDLTVGESNHTDKREFSITDNTQINWNGVANVLEFYKNADGTGTPTKATEVAYAKFVGAVNLNSMKEDVTYTGVIKFYDDKGTYLSTNEIKVTKKLPTVVPSYFSAKTNAINNGVLSVYPNPANGKGEFDLNRAFNGLGENLADKFELSSAALTTDGLASLSYNKITDINPAIINDGKTYAAAMSYNYGKIEYQPVGAGVAKIEDYKVKWNTDFAIKFGCVPVDSKYTWTGNAPVVYYKEDKTINPVTKYNEDGSAAAWGDFLTVKDPYGQTIDPFSNTKPSTDWNWGIWSPLLSDKSSVTVELITNGDKVNEFFTAEIVPANGKQALKLTQTSTAVVLSGDVETTVVFKFKDKFGHDHAIKALTFTMKKDHNE